MRFEAHIPSTAQAKTSTKTEVHPRFVSNSKKTQGGRGTSSKNSSGGQRSGKPAGEGNPKSDTTPTTSKTDKKCFKCGDQTHGVFQRPNIASPTEAKELHEKSTGKKVLKPVLAVAPTMTVAINTEITLDSAAEVSVVTTKLLKLLSGKGKWLARQDLPESTSVTTNQWL
eukprot:jgi/Phyca11/133173/e_gw1.350.2.1